ncbi:conjugal transfer protein TraN [Candidatus Neptunochlamydia vexilliferae]|uniref:Conjugal transfer mating pair stabilization protein TraN n=1 Tax=Candidatus Neptunichlamydia vexilliferae TaxID=1651774 RepID=A0ABS0AY56_9BACT|nr:conjugal transfer protein TraN [Candidatus Neptunochlamydia vexilliferae]MBF5059068.1 hypothetical protein [Candidatus Neptunochlamydia vexilliferae]
MSKQLLIGALFLFAALCLSDTSLLFGADSLESEVKTNLKRTKEEAKALAKEGNHQAKTILESFFSGKNLSIIEPDELLPEEDRGKTFDETLAAEKTDKQELLPLEADLQEMLDASLRVEEIEGSEAFLTSSRATLENAQKGIGILHTEEQITPEETHLKTCHEGGSFIKTIDKARVVTIIPQKTQTVRICLGHKKEKKFFWEGDAKNQLRAWEKELSSDPNLKTWRAYPHSGGLFSSYHVVKTWTHKEGFFCDKSQLETKVLQKEKELDRWEPTPADKKTLQTLEANIDCHLLQTQEFHPGSRTISGKPLYRDSWNQRLIFSCKPAANSKCKRLQEQGGILIKRTCIQEDPSGDCLTWEKTYDLGGKAAHTSQKVTFQEEELFDLEDFDPSYEKNRDFGQVISTLGALESLGQSISEKGLDPHAPAIFSGKTSKCRRSFDSKNLFDCCHKKDCKGGGVFIGLTLGKCNKEEKDLFEKVQEKKCHRIGSIKKLLMTEHVYCCFPTKLARIIQEEGHKQLGISWGKPENPSCQGLTLSQLQSLNFEHMDFTDFIEELHKKIDSQKLAAKLQSLAADFAQSLSKEKVQAKTEEKTELSKKTKHKQGPL